MSKRARQIDVNPIGDRNYAVVVGGLLWCYAFCEPRGMHGAVYRIQYSKTDEPIKEAGGVVTLWSDKHWLSSEGFYGSTAKKRAEEAGRYKSIRDRIGETVTRLVKKKLVISPEEREHRREAQAAIRLQKREEFEAASRKRLDAKAKEIVRKFAVGETVVYQVDRNRLGLLIIEAMEWARSNT